MMIIEICCNGDIHVCDFRTWKLSVGLVLGFLATPLDYVFMKKFKKNRSMLALGSKVGFNA